MTRVFLLTCGISLLCFGCGNKTTPQPAAASSAGTNIGTFSAQLPVQSPADLSPILAGLTQALRKFSVEQRRVPASLNELVAAGYLPALPQAPSGKTFGIDPKNLQVIVK